MPVSTEGQELNHGTNPQQGDHHSDIERTRYVQSCAYYKDIGGLLYMDGTLESTSTCMYMYNHVHVYITCIYCISAQVGGNMHVDILPYIVHRAIICLR